MNIVARRKLFYWFSGVLFGGSIVALLVFGLHFGIDFTGGSILEVSISASSGGGGAPSRETIGKTLEELNIGNVVIQPTGENGFLLRFKHVDEQTHQNIVKKLRDGNPGSSVIEKRFDSIGPTIGKELRTRSLYALVIVLVLIIMYIAWAFRKVSKPVSSWKYGVVAVVALFHDVVIPIGIFAVLGKYFGIEVDTLFVTAILTILGFSVHDTIVVFDRIRENLKGARSGAVFEDIVAKSLTETIGRSVNTSFSVLLSLAAIYFFGGGSVKYFSLAMMTGVVFGTYSSIFIASPLVVSWQKFTESRAGRGRGRR